MQGISLQHHSPRSVYPQTRDLPFETWQEIFWLASHAQDRDEFMTNVGSYRNVWDGRSVMNPEEDACSLRAALRMRWTITRVCRAWYEMGIGILYSHIGILRSSKRPAVQRLVDNLQLLSHTKRLTIVPSHGYCPQLDPIDRLAWTAHLCRSLPRLRVLDVPGTLLLSLSSQSFSSSLTVAIFRGCQLTNCIASVALASTPVHAPAWCNVRVLKLDIDSLYLHNEEWRRHLAEMDFASVEQLYFNEGIPRYMCGTHVIILEYISARLRFPKLHTLSIGHFQWREWWGFLEAHSQTLKILSLTTYGDAKAPEDKEVINFPVLECLYLDYYDIYHTILAGNVTRVGWHYVGCDIDVDEPITEGDKAEILRHLLLTLDYWPLFPTATTYCITGLPDVLDLLEEQPEVVKFISTCRKRGADVEFIHMDKYSYR
jgi:hypothetical protein